MGAAALEKTLSDEVREMAFVALNGELAWNKNDVSKAIDEIVRKGYRILGGEVWTLIPINQPIELHLASGSLRGKPYKVSGSVFAKNNLSGIYGWTTGKPESGMSYEEWGAKEALRWISDKNIESIVLDEYRNNVFYNLTISDKEVKSYVIYSS